MMIRGHVFNSDGKPAFARVIALPNTSYGARILLSNKEGYFEIPWLPAWLDEGRSIILIAKSGHMAPRGEERKNEAAIVEITDPAQPVTIHLGPVCDSLEAKVVDPNGQRLEKYTATLSLTKKFKCQAPIFGTIVGFLRERIFSPIPYGTKYILTIEAEGYKNKEVMVDATDRNKKIIDIGTITLQPESPAQFAVAKQDVNPDLEREFHDIYRLDEGEVIKFIKPPFVLGRQEYQLDILDDPTFALQAPGLQFGFHWDNELQMYSGYGGHNVWWVLFYVLGIPEYDYNLPKDLKIKLAGDWIIRTNSSKDEQLKALEEIIYAETKRIIRFEKRTVERDVIVATGRFDFKPLKSEKTDWLYLCLNENDRLVGNIVTHQPVSINELLPLISNTSGIDIKIDDRTEKVEVPKIKCRCSADLALNMSKEREKNLPILLDNLAKQTGLQFTVEKRPADIWFVTETKEN
jgi:hypothetical protein